MVIERYSHVMHIVSNVSGELAEGRTAFDALLACFPAGTVSGRAEGARDGDHRFAGEDTARPLRGSRWLLRLRGRPRYLHHDPHDRRYRGTRLRAGGGRRSRGLGPRAEADETRRKAEALLAPWLARSGD